MNLAPTLFNPRPNRKIDCWIEKKSMNWALLIILAWQRKCKKKDLGRYLHGTWKGMYLFVQPDLPYLVLLSTEFCIVHSGRWESWWEALFYVQLVYKATLYLTLRIQNMPTHFEFKFEFFLTFMLSIFLMQTLQSSPWKQEETTCKSSIL